jgi:very-short-patch-repair endonuclease
MRLFRIVRVYYRAYKMRKNLTYYERKTKVILEDLGARFSTQHVVYPFIVDFLIGNIVLEIDGQSHLHSDVYDDRRSAYLSRLGYHVFRLANADVNEANIKSLIDNELQLD